MGFLGGGNSNMFNFIFTPKIGEDEPILTSIFQRGGSTTNYFFVPLLQFVFIGVFNRNMIIDSTRKGGGL